jgi:hypothetical protein
MESLNYKFEECATSKKHTELATQHCADQALNTTTTTATDQESPNYFNFGHHLRKKRSMCETLELFIKQSINRFLKNNFENMSRDERNLMCTEEVKNFVNTSTLYKALSLKIDQENTITPDTTSNEVKDRSRSRSRRNRKSKDNTDVETPLEEKGTLEKCISEVNLEEKDSHKRTRHEKIVSREERRLNKLKESAPEKVDKYLEKLESRKVKREALSKLSDDDLKKLREERKRKATERKTIYKELNENLLKSIPDDLGHLIIDGNNMRGGGRRRHSRDTIIKHIKETLEIDPTLKNSTVTVYFDHKPANYIPITGITVKFSGDEIADDSIVKETQDVIKSKSVLVVTNDRLLGGRILQSGGLVMKNKQFNTINPNAPSSNTH